VKQAHEWTWECKISLCIVVVDYENAFDSIQMNTVVNTLVHHSMPKKYVRTLLNINIDCTTAVRLFHSKIEILINRGARQALMISPKFFTTDLENVFRKFN
jgi:hypothetical protein